MYLERLRTASAWLVLAAILGVSVLGLASQPGMAQESRRPVGGEAKSLDGLQAPAKPEISDEDRKYISDIVDPEDLIDIASGRLKLLVLKEPPTQIMLSGGQSLRDMLDARRMAAGGRRGGVQNPFGGGFGGLRGPAAAGAGERLVTAASNQSLLYNLVGDSTLVLIAQAPGTSVLNVWFADKKDSKKEKLLSLIIRVDAKYRAPKTAPSETFKEFVEQVMSPQKPLELVVGRPRVLVLTQTPKRVIASNAGLIGCRLLGGEEGKQLYIEAAGPGSADFLLLFTDAENPKRDKILGYFLKALPDPQAPAPASPGANAAGKPTSGGPKP